MMVANARRNATGCPVLACAHTAETVVNITQEVSLSEFAIIDDINIAGALLTNCIFGGRRWIDRLNAFRYRGDTRLSGWPRQRTNVRCENAFLTWTHRRTLD
jgi:hypothetical protein